MGRQVGGRRIEMSGNTALVLIFLIIVGFPCLVAISENIADAIESRSYSQEVSWIEEEQEKETSQENTYSIK